MIYTKIRPLGIRRGPGTFDGVFNTERYRTMDEALAANDILVIDFVQDEEGVIYFEFYHTKDPASRRHYKLEVQYFPAGVDAFDDESAMRLANRMLQFF